PAAARHTVVDELQRDVMEKDLTGGVNRHRSSRSEVRTVGERHVLVPPADDDINRRHDVGVEHAVLGGDDEVTTVRLLLAPLPKLLAKRLEVELVAVLVDRDVRSVGRREHEPSVLDLQEQPDPLLGRRRIEGSLAARLLLVDLQPRELVPDRRHEEEHDAAEEQVDERDQRDLAVDALLSASAITTSANAGHRRSPSWSRRPARSGAGSPTSGVRTAERPRG